MKIVLVGASVRPLIASCIAAEIAPRAFDLFADWDSQQMIDTCGLPEASLEKIESYDQLLNRDIASLGNAAILSGGAELVMPLAQRVADQMPLLGPNPGSLADLRNPMAWLDFLKGCGFNVPDSQWDPPASTNRRWLMKSVGSCGGRGVGWLPPTTSCQSKPTHERSAERDRYFQRFIPGPVYSAVLASEPGRGATVLIGYSRQKFQTDNPFAYAGSQATDVPDRLGKQILAIANCLHQQFDLKGVWGLDFVLAPCKTGKTDQAGVAVWPVDVNPRITASAELFEMGLLAATGFGSIVDLHRSSCGLDSRWQDRFAADQPPNTRAFQFASRKYLESKRILFNTLPQSVVVTAAMFNALKALWSPVFFRQQRPAQTLADIPQLGVEIKPGYPILTIRTRARRDDLFRDRDGLDQAVAAETEQDQTGFDFGQTTDAAAATNRFELAVKKIVGL